MELHHLSTKHVTKLAHNLLVPRIILQTNFRLNLHHGKCINDEYGQRKFCRFTNLQHFSTISRANSVQYTCSLYEDTINNYDYRDVNQISLTVTRYLNSTVILYTATHYSTFRQLTFPNSILIGPNSLYVSGVSKVLRESLQR